MTMRWDEKRYYSLDYYLKQTYGEKLYKIALDGMTCPNRTALLVCTAAFSAAPEGPVILPVIGALPLPNRLKPAKLKASSTVVPPHCLLSGIHEHLCPGFLFEIRLYRAINHPDIRILSIATRPDCLNDDVLALLAELNKKKPVWVELGLRQSMKKLHSLSGAAISFQYSRMLFGSFERLA